MTSVRRDSGKNNEEPAATETGFLSGLKKAVGSLRPKGGFFSRAADQINSAQEDNADESPKSKSPKGKSPKGKSPKGKAPKTAPVKRKRAASPPPAPAKEVRDRPARTTAKATRTVEAAEPEAADVEVAAPAPADAEAAAKKARIEKQLDAEQAARERAEAKRAKAKAAERKKLERQWAKGAKARAERAERLREEYQAPLARQNEATAAFEAEAQAAANKAKAEAEAEGKAALDRLKMFIVQQQTPPPESRAANYLGSPARYGSYSATVLGAAPMARFSHPVQQSAVGGAALSPSAPRQNGGEALKIAAAQMQKQRMRDVAAAFYSLCGMERDAVQLATLEAVVAKAHPAWGTKEAVADAVGSLESKGFVKREGRKVVGVIFAN